MSKPYEPTFMAEAYDLLVKSLKDQLATERGDFAEEKDAEAFKQVEIDDVIFSFVLQHCGRNKLLELGKLIDEMLEKEYGSKEGFEEVVAGYQLTQPQE
jgi:hypothetical protein